jgi:integrase
VKVVSEMLGHADVGITLSIYAHLLPNMQDGAADTMDDALG